MSNIGTPLSSTIPAVGSTGTQYATDINAFLTEVKGRLEALVPISSIQVGQLDMVNNAIVNLEYALLYPQGSAPTTPTGSLQNFGGDLYWVSPAGAAKITTGAAVNATGIGGITGDYGGSNPAQLRFVDADKEYYFYDDFAGGAWAHIRALDLEIAGGATSSVRARINWNGVGSYTLTLPAALPGSQVLLQLANTGQLTASNSLPTDVNITLSGTGEIKHGDRTRTQDALTTAFTGGCGPSFGVSADVAFNVVQSATAFFGLRSLAVGDRVKSITIAGYTTGTGVPTFTTWNSVNQGNTIITNTVSGGPLASTGFTTFTFDTPVTVVAHNNIWLKIVNPGALVTIISQVDYVYDRP